MLVLTALDLEKFRDDRACAPIGWRKPVGISGNSIITRKPTG